MGNQLSIVIIGRNEESSIRHCAKAALAAAEKIGGAELIYVDSHSTDNTVAIMESYGFKVVSLSPGLRMTPSAGRYVGSRTARGEFVLFLDADTLIYPDFLDVALGEFESDRCLGGCNGRIDDFTETGERVLGVEEPCNGDTTVKWLRGPCCLYRRKALIEARSFDPELAMEEEAELGLRIIKQGWQLKKIAVPMAKHTRCYHGDSMTSIIATFIRDKRAKRLGEIAKTISHAFLAGNGFSFCWLRLKTTILFLVWLSMVAAALLLPSEYHPWKLATVLTISGGVAIYAKKRSLYQTLIFLPSKILNLIDILLGIHKIRLKSYGMPSREAVADQ